MSLIQLLKENPETRRSNQPSSPNRFIHQYKRKMVRHIMSNNSIPILTEKIIATITLLYLQYQEAPPICHLRRRWSLKAKEKKLSEKLKN